jgi:hypothetical protein
MLLVVTLVYLLQRVNFLMSPDHCFGPCLFCGPLYNTLFSSRFLVLATGYFICGPSSLLWPFLKCFGPWLFKGPPSLLWPFFSVVAPGYLWPLFVVVVLFIVLWLLIICGPSSLLWPFSIVAPGYLWPLFIVVALF